MSEFAIELEDVSKRYRLFRNGRWRILDVLGLHVPRNVYHDFWALQDISLSVPSGQRFGIIGRNGAGKSSLLKIIAGLIKPTEGKVSVKGNVQTLMELGTGFHPEFTGRQNVFAALALAGVTGRDAQARFDDIVDFAELEGFIDSPLKTYSSGMQARLAFSVATTFKPEILIIDEILSVGDAYFAGKCFERMSKLTREQGATVLYVSHDLSSVQAACDRVVWLKRGRVFQDGDPLSVVMAYYKEVQVVELTVRIGYAIFTVATLAFLGFSPGDLSTPDWGVDINETFVNIQSDQWWMTIFPAIAIATLVVAVNLVADSIDRVVEA